MKIRKTDIPNLDTESKILAAVKIHADELEYRANIGNKTFTQNIKIRELHNHILNNLPWEFIDKTLEEERAADKLSAEEKTEQQKQDRIILAKTDPIVRDLLITELMNTAGFVKDDVMFNKFQYDNSEINQTKFDQFMSYRALKLSEIKTMISES